jgi:hypothetical protein
LSETHGALLQKQAGATLNSIDEGRTAGSQAGTVRRSFFFFYEFAPPLQQKQGRVPSRRNAPEPRTPLFLKWHASTPLFQSSAAMMLRAYLLISAMHPAAYSAQRCSQHHAHPICCVLRAL